jgi:glutamate-1-semialdehyde 2,1-aminomutase
MRDAGRQAVATGDGPVFTLHLQDRRPCTYRDTIADDMTAYSDFTVGLLDEGIQVLPDARWYVSAAHTDQDIERTLAAAAKVMGQA